MYLTCRFTVVRIERAEAGIRSVRFLPTLEDAILGPVRSGQASIPKATGDGSIITKSLLWAWDGRALLSGRRGDGILEPAEGSGAKQTQSHRCRRASLLQRYTNYNFQAAP